MDRSSQSYRPICSDKEVTGFFRIMDAFFRFSEKHFWIQVTVNRILVVSRYSITALWRETLESNGSRTEVLTNPTKNVYCRQLLCCHCQPKSLPAAKDPVFVN